MMLPYYPKVAAYTGDQTRETLRALAQRMSIVSEMKMRIQHEGKRQSIARHDGSQNDVKMRSLELSDVIHRDTTLEEFDAEEVLRRVTRMATMLADGQSENALETMREATESTGNVVDAGGKPLTPELLLAVIEKIAPSFNEKGQWQAPSIVVGPGMYDKIRSMFTPEVEADYNVKMEELISRKREEHLAREAGRVLAG